MKKRWLLIFTALFFTLANMGNVWSQTPDTGEPFSSGTNNIEIACGDKTNGQTVNFPSIPVCGKNADDARNKYEELVKDDLKRDVECLYPENCEGSECELFVWDFNPPSISGLIGVISA